MSSSSDSFATFGSASLTIPVSPRRWTPSTSPCSNSNCHLICSSRSRASSSRLARSSFYSSSFLFSSSSLPCLSLDNSFSRLCLSSSSACSICPNSINIIVSGFFSPPSLYLVPALVVLNSNSVRELCFSLALSRVS